MVSKGALVTQCEEITAKLPALMEQLQLRIRSEEQGIIPIVPNKPQVAYHNTRLTRPGGGYSSHDLILKARKHGFSTWKLLEALVLALFVPGFGSGLVVQEDRTARRMFRILRFAYNHLDQAIKDEIPNVSDRTDGIELANGSYVNIITAGTRSGSGRGDTYHYLHFTEVSSYFDPEELVNGLRDACPRFAHIAMESTARGRGNYWHEQCEKAASGESSYFLYFYAWWFGDECWLPLEKDEVIIPTEEEIDIITRAKRDGFDLTSENLKWRRQKKADAGELFYQEQAEDPETCFLATGRPVFDQTLLRRLVQRADSALILEQERAPGGGERIVWRRSVKNFPYVVSVDVSEGLPHGDWSVVSTWQNTPEGLVQCARTRLLCSYDDLASYAVEEAKLYHNALIAVERNSIGSAVIQKIDSMGYTNQYRQLDKDGQETDTVGWHTNARSKKIMIEELAANTEGGDIISFDRELWVEASNITRDELGRPVTPKRKHDDIFMAACIANQARDQANSLSAGNTVGNLLG